MARLHSVVAVFILLWLNGIASASILLQRQDDPAATDTPERPTEPTSSADSDASSTASETASPSSETATADSTSSSDSSTPSQTGTPLNSTNDPGKCHISVEQQPVRNFFCRPRVGQEWDYDADYKVTWDPSRFPENSSNIVEVYVTSFLNETTDRLPMIQHSALIRANNTPNAIGETLIHTEKSWLNGSSKANLTIQLAVTPPPEEGAPQSYPGPHVILLNKAGDDNSDSDGDDKKLGQKVGIPVGLMFFFVIIAAIVFFFLRRRRRGADYLAKRPHHQRAQSGSIGGLVGPMDRSHRRTESFHDEPTRGVELQERKEERESGGNWGWGSPTSPKGGNVFREEMGRQETGRAI